MAALSWMSSESALPVEFSATVERTEVLLAGVRFDDISGSETTTETSGRGSDDDLLLMPRTSTTPARRGSETLEARRVKKIKKDLLAIIEEDTEIELDAASVTTDVRHAAKTIIKKKEDTIRGVLLKIRSAQQVHLAFLVGTTDSIAPHIYCVRQQIKDICALVLASTGGLIGRQGGTNSNNSSCVSVAFVGYKDFCDGPNHFEVLPFIKDLVSFQAFVDRIVATGGGNGPEDVNGGLRKALDGLQLQKYAAPAYHDLALALHGCHNTCLRKVLSGSSFSSSTSRQWAWVSLSPSLASAVLQSPLRSSQLEA